MAPDVPSSAAACVRVIDDDDDIRLPEGADLGGPLDDVARLLYRDMVLARRFDQEAFALQRQGELALWLQCQGQEAAQVGSIRAVRDTDFVFPSYRDHAAAIARGVTPEELLALWRGATHGGWDPAAHRFQIYTLVLGTQLLHAVGYAMGVRLDGTDDVVMTYVGDGAMSEGDASEALNWAATADAPVVFMCQNNAWAISTPNAKQFRTPLHVRARGFGLDGYCVDGNDALAVHIVMREAVSRVRAGGPPAFVEAFTYRIGGHSTSDDPTRYRADDEVQDWLARDPIPRLRRAMDKAGLADASYYASLDAEADALAASVRSACLALEPISLSEFMRNTYVTETASLRREREFHEEFQRSFA